MVKSKEIMKEPDSFFKRKILPRWQLYLFLLIPLIYIIVFAYIPMVGLQLAFKKYDLNLGIWDSPWVGLAQFQRFFKVYNFKEILTNTIVLALYGIIASFPIPIILALLLNSFPSVKYKKTVQTISYMPYFISTVVIVGILVQLLNPRTGALGALWQTFTGKFMTSDVLGNPKAFRHIYVWSGIWQSAGWNSIIYTAALAGVSAELHEAAEIDGATRWQRVKHIDFPSILPTAVILLIMSAGNIMNIGFEKVYLLQNNMNLTKSEVISTYVYKVGMQIGGGDFSFATAIGLFNSLINFTLLTIVNGLSRGVSGTSLW